MGENHRRLADEEKPKASSQHHQPAKASFSKFSKAGAPFKPGSKASHHPAGKAHSPHLKHVSMLASPKKKGPAAFDIEQAR